VTATSASSGGPRAGGGTEGTRGRPWLCLVPAALLLPFLDKAFNIDDPFFLEYARVLSSRPLHPFGLTFFFNGGPTAVLLQPQPLGWSFLLAGARALFGESEPWLHLLNVAFALLGLHALREIAVRLGVSAPAACWLFAGSSVFLCLGSTIMPYLAWSALSLAAMARVIRGVDERRTADLVAAGVLAAAAFLCCFAGAIVIVLLAAYPLLAGRFSGRATIAPGIGVAVIVACDLWSLGTIGTPHFLFTLFRWSQDLGPGEALANGSTEVALLGAQLPVLGLPLVAIVLGRRRGPWIVTAALVVALALCLGIPETNPLARGELWVWPGLAVLGDGLVQLAAGAAKRARGAPTSVGAKRALLGLWLLVATFATVRYVNRSAKYMLLPLPAAILLTLDAVQGLEGRRARIGRWALALSLPLSLALGATVALSDYRFAGLARAFFAERYPSLAPSSGTAYFDGEWGMRYYAERAGVPQYRSQSLRPGDRLLYSNLQGRPVLDPCPPLPPDECAPVTWLRMVAIPQVSYPGPFAVLGDSAGFWSDHFGAYSYRRVRRWSDDIVVQEKP
jgi:hypothetical protein